MMDMEATRLTRSYEAFSSDESLIFALYLTLELENKNLLRNDFGDLGT